MNREDTVAHSVGTSYLSLKKFIFHASWLYNILCVRFYVDTTIIKIILVNILCFEVSRLQI